MQEEKRRNPQFESGLKGSGEWAAAYRTDPALLRAALAVKFQEYRNAGGPASWPEDVREFPDSCAPEGGSPGKPSPVTATRTLPLPGR